MSESDPILKYSTARGYVQSALLLISNPARFQVADDSSFFPAFHMLCGFAVELYLKSFLEFAGLSERDLIRAGHNLFALQTLAHEKGLSDPAIVQLVDYLGEKHKSLEFRYMKASGRYDYGDLRLVFSTFSTLDNRVDELIGARASYGLSSGGEWLLSERQARWRFTS